MLLLDIVIVSGIYSGARLAGKLRAKKLHQVDTAASVNNRETEQTDSRSAQQGKPGKALNTRTVAVNISVVALSILRPIYPITYPVFMLCVSYAVYPVFKTTEVSLLQEKKLPGSIINFICFVFCIATGQYPALILGALLYAYAQDTLARTRQNLKGELKSIFNELPERVWLWCEDGSEVEIALSSVQTGDVLVCRTGDRVPVDGRVLDGEALIDQHTLTGEFQPAEKASGDPVFASTVVMSGRIRVRIEKTGEQTLVARINDILNGTADYKSALQLRGEKWADQSILPSMALSALSIPLVHVAGAVAVLNSGFESRILVVAPLGTLNYLTIASKKKVFIKDGRVLESANQVDTILFDKTGTLTHELPEVGHITPCNGYDRDTILSYAATAEDRMAHPIARAITAKARSLGIDYVIPKDSDYKMGYGISVTVGGHLVKVGSIRFMQLEGITLPETSRIVIEDCQGSGHSTVLVAVDGQLSGIIELLPSIRPEIPEIMRGLRKRGIKHLSIVSGDQKKPVQKLAASLGMDSYFAEVLPEEKASIVERLKSEGRTVCFIGDGINDTIAMKKADVSISLSGATSIATDVAQVVLMDGDLSRLCEFFELSKSLKDNSQRVLVFTLAGTVVNIAGVFFLSFGLPTTMWVNAGSLALSLANAKSSLFEETWRKSSAHIKEFAIATVTNNGSRETLREKITPSP